MATVFVDGRRPIKYKPATLVGLPWKALTESVHAHPVQRFIPFLGAGASLPQGSLLADSPPPKAPTSDTLDRLCGEFDISEASARRFLEISIEFAQVLARHRVTTHEDDPADAPTSWELANRFAAMLQLEPFLSAGEALKRLLQEPNDRGDYVDVVRHVADVMGLSKSVPQLLTVASYFNDGVKRGLLRQSLRARFTDVKHATPIQRRIAEVAKRFVTRKNIEPDGDPRDYVIITTNYDSLLELSLKAANVPTCLVTVNLKNKEVIAEVQEHTKDALGLDADAFGELQRMYQEEDTGIFSDTMSVAAAGAGAVRVKRRTTRTFALSNKTHSLAMVFKIHGDPSLTIRPPVDNLVISDQDYVRFIQMNGDDNQLVPAYISSRMSESSLLFLGYSFSDWNVRSMYRSFVKKRDDDQHRHSREIDDVVVDEIPKNRDFIVMRSLEGDDAEFLSQWDVSVLVTELDWLADALE